MAYERDRKTTKAFTPAVSGLEERNLMSVAGVRGPARIRMAQVGRMQAASHTNAAPRVMPLGVLAGTWATTTWTTKAFSDQFPDLPSTFQSVDVNEHIGNSIVSTESEGGLQVDWAITRTHRGLFLTVSDPFGGQEIVMPGRRIGPATWAFQSSTEIPGAPQLRSVFSVVNRNAYAFSNFAVETGVQNPQMTLLYASMNMRLQHTPVE